MNPQDGQGTQLNPEHVINSLLNQISTLTLNNAQLNAVIIELSEQHEVSGKVIKELEMENKQLHEGKKSDKKEVKK